MSRQSSKSSRVSKKKVGIECKRRPKTCRHFVGKRHHRASRTKRSYCKLQTDVWLDDGAFEAHAAAAVKELHVVHTNESSDGETRKRTKPKKIRRRERAREKEKGTRSIHFAVRNVNSVQKHHT